MTANMIGDHEVLAITNWADSMCGFRLTFEAVSPGDGGDSLALKKIGKKYIDKKAGVWEDAVNAWLTAKRKENRRMMIALLRGAGWTMKKFEATDEDDLPPEIKQIWYEWQEAYPDPTYQDVPLDIIIPYVAVDGILTNIGVRKFIPVLIKKSQVDTFAMECDLLPVVFEMVRAGFLPDRDYLIECHGKLSTYIHEQYQLSYALAGREFTVGQHKVIKAMYEESTGESLTSVDKPVMQRFARDGDQLALIIGKLRTCEKWLSTYIVKLLSDSEYDGRCYPSLNPYNPITGRFSGDFQQMPKDALLTIEGDEFKKKFPNDPVPPEMELYHPRKAIVTSGGIYNKTAYIDISQYELRWGAHYTLRFGGDTNLCRAYMPFKCIHHLTGEMYDPENPDHIKRWDERAENGKSAWIYPPEEEAQDETTGLSVIKHWTKTDVHSATTIRALPAMGLELESMSEELFEYWRQKGKRYNFLKFYGGGAKKASEALEIALAHAQALDKGFVEAFPLLGTYSKAVIDTADRDGFVQNLYGRRYYLSRSFYLYKLANYLIQGGTADDFKRKLIIVYRWLKENGVISRMVHVIHDELIMDIADGEEWILPHIKAILEHTPVLNLPVVAEVSLTESTWERKKKIA
jgi:DNA polymerase-1